MQGLVRNAQLHSHRRAIRTNGIDYSYGQLLQASEKLALALLENHEDLAEARVAFMVNPGFDYVRAQWAIWRAGGVAVPLCLTYPLPSLQYVLEDTGAEVIVVSPEYAELLTPLTGEKGLRLLVLGKENRPGNNSQLPAVAPSRRAMILYTSGTTSLPKGVVTTHANIEAQITTLVEAWQWTSTDHTLCILPLHHVHGIINVVSCALWSGATCEFLDRFSPEEVISVFERVEMNVFMAVPTIYFKLIAYIEQLPAQKQSALHDLMSGFRLMVSGSAALPVGIMEKWEHLSGHRLLERYGMTEIGMAISNPYQGERRPGCIGQPLPGVEIRLTDEHNTPVSLGQPGEIQVKGKSVFLEYWNKPEATRKSFTNDGWFKTGDIAVVEDGYYRILGRDSVDIIKSGGYKISALEIEEILRTHPIVVDCSVVGLPDEEWGELVAAALILKADNADLSALNEWLRERMPAYKTPRKYVVVGEFPKNAMGKVTKNELKQYF